MKTIVIYHASCTDGFCAAWLFHKVYPNAVFIPAQYGNNMRFSQVDPGDSVFILDFSYPRDQMIQLHEYLNKDPENKGSLVVLDHHKTAQENCVGLDFCFFDMEKSGARLAWDYLVNRGLIGTGDLPDLSERMLGTYDVREFPMTLVAYVEDRDLWRFRLPFSKEINSAIRSYPMDFDSWNQMVDRSLSDLRHEGAAIERYRKVLIEQHVRNAVPVLIGGHQIQGVACTCGEIISEVAETLSLTGPFGTCWFDLVREGKKERVYSLRSRGDFDVSAVAREYGGGGHKNAAGFKVSREQAMAFEG